MGVSGEGVEAAGGTISPKNRCSAGAASGTGYRKGLRGENSSGCLRPQAHHPTSSGDSASPSVPFVTDPQLTRGLGDAVAGSPGDSAASAILALLRSGRSHKPLRRLRRGSRSGLARHRAGATSSGGAGRRPVASAPRSLACPPGGGERLVSPRFGSSGPRVPPHTLPV